MTDPLDHLAALMAHRAMRPAAMDPPALWAVCIPEVRQDYRRRARPLLALLDGAAATPTTRTPEAAHG